MIVLVLLGCASFCDFLKLLISIRFHFLPVLHEHTLYLPSLLHPTVAEVLAVDKGRARDYALLAFTRRAAAWAVACIIGWRRCVLALPFVPQTSSVQVPGSPLIADWSYRENCKGTKDG